MMSADHAVTVWRVRLRDGAERVRRALEQRSPQAVVAMLAAAPLRKVERERAYVASAADARCMARALTGDTSRLTLSAGEVLIIVDSERPADGGDLATLQRDVELASSVGFVTRPFTEPPDSPWRRRAVLVLAALAMLVLAAICSPPPEPGKQKATTWLRYFLPPSHMRCLSSSKPLTCVWDLKR